MATTITAGNSTNGAAISSDNTGILELKTGSGAGTTAMTVNASQNVGIGTSSPSSDAIVRFVNVSDATSSGVVMTAARKYSIYSSASSTLEFRDETAAASRAAITSTGLFQFNSGYGSVATAYGCRAWVNFDGTGTYSPNPSTSKIRASGNVTSITKNTTGDYTVNLTTAMPDVNYLVACAGRVATSGANINPLSESASTSALRVLTFNTAWASLDLTYVYVALFR